MNARLQFEPGIFISLLVTHAAGRVSLTNTILTYIG
jgi:hypothetical protein